MRKRLKRYEHDGMICGVCEGLGNYHDINPLLFRAIFIALLTYSATLAIIVYIILTIAIPSNDY